MKTRARLDGNHREVVQALQAIGCSVQSLAAVGKSCPDLLVGYRGRNVLLEVKAGRGKLTDGQAAWQFTWAGQVSTVWSSEEAVAVMQETAGDGGPTR